MKSSGYEDGATPEFDVYRGSFATVQHTLHRFPVLSPLVVLVISWLVFAWASETSRFATWTTTGTLLNQTAVLGTLAVGQTLIILTAGVDLAVGTGMLLTNIVVAKAVFSGFWFIDSAISAPLALALGAAVGVSLGALHGVLITRIRLPPFIVTLGTFYVFQSIGLVYSEAQTFSKEQLGGGNSLLLLGARRVEIGPLTVIAGVLVMLALYAVFSYVLASTAWGSHVYAAGDDPEAARLAGIDVNRVIFSVYIVAGLIYAIGGWVQLGRAESASSNGAADVNLQTITAVVIGGTSLFGGRGKLLGTLIGGLIVSVFGLGLTQAGVDVYWQNAAIGSLIIVAVTLDQWIRKVAR